MKTSVDPFLDFIINPLITEKFGVMNTRVGPIMS